jgi:alkylation response protein AidB-like acyl-CoA dehydrogenase
VPVRALVRHSRFQNPRHAFSLAESVPRRIGDNRRCMDAPQDDTLRLLRESVRRFVENEVAPHGAAWEEQGLVPREVLEYALERGLYRPPP